MGVSKERLHDSHLSVWNVTPEAAVSGSAWTHPLKALARLTGAIKQARQERHPQDRHLLEAGQAQARPQERSSGEMTTLPSGGRGQALREAHRDLRRQMRGHPALRQVFPHLYFVERSLARHGTAALFDMPLWVMQRALPQLDRLPLDEHPDALDHPLNTLRLRLIEAIEVRNLQVAVEPPAPEHADSFHGSPDTLDSPDGRMGTLGPMSLPPAGIVVDELPDSAFYAPAVDPPHRSSAHHSGPDRRRR